MSKKYLNQSTSNTKQTDLSSKSKTSGRNAVLTDELYSSSNPERRRPTQDKMHRSSLPATSLSNSSVDSRSLSKKELEEMKRLSEEEQAMKRENTEVPGVRGLENVGNLCYLNSVLQCLSSVEPLRYYFLGKQWSEENLDLGLVTLAFSNILNKMWRSKCTIIDPEDLVKRISKVDNRFNDGKQHDPQELLIYLLDALNTELRRKPEVSSVSVSATSISTVKHETTVTNKTTSRTKEAEAEEEEEAFECETEWAKHLSVSDSIINDLFYGQLRISTRCTGLKCAHEYLRFDPFCTLSVPVATRAHQQTLSDTNKSTASLTSKTVDRLVTRQLDFIFVPHMPYRFIGFQRKFDNSIMLSHILLKVGILIEEIPLRYFRMDSSPSLSYSSEIRFKFRSVLSQKYIAIVLFDNLFISDVIFHDSVHKNLSEVTDNRSPIVVYEFSYTANERDRIMVIPLYIRVKDNGIPDVLSSVPILLQFYDAIPHYNSDLYNSVKNAIQRYFKCDIKGIQTPLFAMNACHRNGLTVSLEGEKLQLADVIHDSSTHPPVLIYVDIFDEFVEYMRKEACQLKSIDLDSMQETTTTELNYSTNASLPVSPSAHNVAADCCTLDECLRLFFNVPPIKSHEDDYESDDSAKKGDFDFFCEKCKRYTTPTHETKLSKLPRVLVIHLKRFNAHSKKVETFVKYPLRLKFTDLEKYLVQDSTFIIDQLNKLKVKGQKLPDLTLYELAAVINHSGTLLVGHCTALCRNFMDENWRYFSDTQYNVIDVTEVVSPLAYVLIYVMPEVDERS